MPIPKWIPVCIRKSTSPVNLSLSIWKCKYYLKWCGRVEKLFSAVVTLTESVAKILLSNGIVGYIYSLQFSNPSTAKFGIRAFYYRIDFSNALSIFDILQLNTLFQKKKRYWTPNDLLF